MRTVLKISILMAILMIAFTGCSKDTPVDNPDNPSNPETPVNVVMQNVALTGLVKDASGNPLSGVKVTTGTANATTGSDGKFSFTQAGTVDDRAVIKFEKSGYFTLTRSGDKEDEMYMNPVMYRKGNDSITLQTSFDASAAKTLQLGGVKIDLPAGCMAKADGSAYSGTVRADVLNLGSGNANTALMIPGGDLATDKSDEMMLPIGMVDVIFTDNAGNLLKIKDKTDVKMSWPAPSGATSLPSSISLWTFDEARGIWLEEGSAMLQGNVYTGTVSHFTPKGAGKRSKTAIMQIHATECDNKPAAGAQVTFNDVTDDDGLGILDNEHIFLYETYYTNSAGVCSVTVPKSWSYWTVNVTYKGQNQRQAFTQGNMGGQSVVVTFTGACGDLPESASLKYNLMSQGGYIEIVTFANYFQRVRVDWFGLGGIQHSIQILDPINNFYEVYQSGGGWVKFPAVDVSTISETVISSINSNNPGEGYTQLSNEIIGGQSCKVFLNNETGMKDYIWRGLGVGSRSANGSFVGVDSITVKVPADAFTEKVDPYWIE